MKKNLFKTTTLIVAMLFTTSVFAQDWVRMMLDPNVNFFETQKTFNQYRNDYIATYRLSNNNAEPAKIPGEKIFKRWEWFMAPRVSANGERFAPDAVWKEMDSYRKTYEKSMGAGTWTSIGPSTPSGIPGIGRVNCIRVHPTNPSTLYAGAPSGGLWISTNGGSSWTTKTDNMPQVIGCTDIAFDPTNPNIMYMATGDGDAGDNYSVGILKSTDGAQTWNPTGLSFFTSQYRMMSRILVDPTNGNNIIVATSAGIYRSTDAAVTFTKVQDGSFKDMEFKPGTPATIYACGTEFYKSTNSGASWTKITSGLPVATNVSRMAIACTAADPNKIYMIVGLPAPNYGTEGFYTSTNSGTSFTKASTPDLGTQQWYDLCVAGSPTSATEVMLGGQTQFYKSTNGGTSWTQIATSTHVDYHDVIYTSGTTAYLASDGGVWKSTDNGSSWSNLSGGLVISQLYGFGQSTSSANLIIGGWQDNGSNSWNGSSWSAEMGGDGMLAFVSWNNNSNMWCSQYNGSLNRKSGGSWSACGTINNATTEPCPWVTQWSEDPVSAGTVWAGCANVWKSTNGGVSWTKPGNVAGTSTVGITALRVSPANNQVVWTAKGGTLYKSTNGGAAWAAVSSLPTGTITDILCHPTNASKAWVSFSGFASMNKVFQTIDQGTTWTNLSASIPNIPVNCMEIDKNGNDALYIGTDNGVFFKDATMNVWQPFSGGLPNVEVTQLHIYYAGSKIRASTYGRGMWEGGLYTPGAYAPSANFGANNFIGCPGLGVQFTDYSAGMPTSWSWTFQGGNPSTSTAQNPFVAYNTPGTYSVSLTVTNANGNDTKTFPGLITISNSPNAAPTSAGDKKFCGATAVTLSVTPSVPGNVRWWNQAAGGSIVGTGNTYTTPATTGDKTYYADEAFTSTATDVVGADDNTMGAGAMFSASDIRGLYFDVLEPVIINSVQVYCNSAGPRTIEIVDSKGNVVTDTTVTLTANASALQTVTINRTLYPGTDYMMKFRGSVDCYRNSAGAAFPYTSSAINITNSNAGSPGYYYFFYNWNYTKIVCNTARTPVTALDTCSPTGVTALTEEYHVNVFPNPSTGEFTASLSFKNSDNYSIKITNQLGQIVYEEKLNNFVGNYSKKINLSSFGKGVYMLRVSNSKNEAVKQILIH